MIVLSVVGARPQFIKLKPLADAVTYRGLKHLIVHSGQHYDPKMSDDLFEDLDIPQPDRNLGVGSASHAKQTADMLVGLEESFKDFKPDWVIVYGDTNSTLAATLAATKMGIPVGHVEAGLRSFNRAMPEELNRLATDHTSTLLFAPTDLAHSNLVNEGLSSRALLVGDVMADLLFSSLLKIDAESSSSILPGIQRGNYLVATIHRASNTDSPEQLERIIKSLESLPHVTVLVAHPRLVEALRKSGIVIGDGNLRTVPPLRYYEMLRLVRRSMGVITDSGGLQKDAYLLGVPCVTLRTESEWPETFEGSMNVLNPEVLNLDQDVKRKFSQPQSKPFGEGDAASKIVDAILLHGSRYL